MKNMFYESKERFSIRKYTVGVASVLLSTLVFAGGNVYADEVKTLTNTETSIVTEEKQGDRNKEYDLERNETSSLKKDEGQANEAVITTNNSVAPTELNSTSSKKFTENPENVDSEIKTETQSTEKLRRTKRETPSPGSETTYVKTGDTITVQNPDVEVNYPNGNSLYAPTETIIHMEIPDELEIKQNDKVVVDIPDEIRIPTSLHYDVTGPSGEVIGNVLLDSVSNKVITTFTDYFEKNKVAKQFTLTVLVGNHMLNQMYQRNLISADERLQ